MTVEHADFARFSRALDTEWLRQRVRSTTTVAASTIDEEELTRALGQADPLGETSKRGWLETMADAFRSWPAKFGVVGIACALVLLGIAVGRLVPTSGPGGQTAVRGVTDAPPLPVYSPEHVSRFGATASVKPDSERRFQEAMALHGTPDFGPRALPLLRAAVADDPSNDQAQFWLGVVLLLNGKNADAVPVLEEAVRLGPGSGLYKRYLVYAYLKIGASEKALALQTEMLRHP